MTDAQALATVNGWLSDLSPNAAQPLQLDTNRQCAVEGGDTQACLVHVPPDSGDVVVYADLAILRAPMPPRFYQEVLSMNMFSEFTRGTVITFDRIDGTLVLFHRVPIETLDRVTFENVLLNFLGTVPDVRAEIETVAERTASDPLGSPAGSARAAGPALTDLRA